MAWDHTFQHAIPGSSLAYKHGSFPHSRPPQHTDPSATLEHIWQLLHKKDHLQQMWLLMEKGADARTIAKALLYKMALEGQIQMNLGVTIFPTVQKMIYSLGKAKGIDVKLAPKMRDKVKEAMDTETLSKLNGDKATKAYPKSALASMSVPKPADAKAAFEAKQKLTAMHEKAKAISAAAQAPVPQAQQVVPTIASNPMQQKIHAPGILGMSAPQPQVGG